jgi:hypothetical protein
VSLEDEHVKTDSKVTDHNQLEEEQTVKPKFTSLIDD